MAYFQGFLIDVTARHEAERIAHEADARFRSLVEQAPAIVYTESVVPGTTRAAAMEYVSPAAVDVLGYPAERWLEDVTFWERIVHPEDAERRRRGHGAGERHRRSADGRLPGHRGRRADGLAPRGGAPGP